MLTELVLLLAEAICQAGIAALLGGAPVLKGVELRPTDATASVPVPLLTDAGFGVIASAEDVPFVEGRAAEAACPFPVAGRP